MRYSLNKVSNKFDGIEAFINDLWSYSSHCARRVKREREAKFGSQSIFWPSAMLKVVNGWDNSACISD